MVPKEFCIFLVPPRGDSVGLKIVIKKSIRKLWTKVKEQGGTISHLCFKCYSNISIIRINTLNVILDKIFKSFSVFSMSKIAAPGEFEQKTDHKELHLPLLYNSSKLSWIFFIKNYSNHNLLIVIWNGHSALYTVIAGLYGMWSL